MTQIYMQSVSGLAIKLPCPDADTILLDDIAYSLSGQNRFNGHSRPHWNVAAHSVLVARLVETNEPDAGPALLLAALLDDAVEYIIGDITTPMKRALAGLCDPGGIDPLVSLEASVRPVIYSAFDLPPELPKDWKKIIRRADLEALKIERFRFMAPLKNLPETGLWEPYTENAGLVAVPDYSILQLAGDPEASYRAFLVAFDRYDRTRIEQEQPDG